VDDPMSDTEREIAESLDADPKVLPFLPYLLQDLESLGCSPDAIVELAVEGGTASSAQVVDLCCGKGAASIQIAKATGCRVLGIDLFRPLVEAARRSAREQGVSDWCRFEVDDVRDRIGALQGVDGVVLAAADAVLGGYRETVSQLRSAVRTKGWMIIEDGFLPEAYPGDPGEGYEHYLPHREAVAELTSHGDTLVQEILVSREEEQAFNRRNTEAIRRRALELVAAHPAESQEILGFAEDQVVWSEASESMETAIWLLRKSDSASG